MLLIFRKETNRYDEVIFKSAEAVKEHLLISYTDLHSEANRRLAEYFGLIDHKQPFLFIVDPRAGDMRKFIGPSEITEDTITRFVK
jgi:hypothetical protein